MTKFQGDNCLQNFSPNRFAKPDILDNANINKIANGVSIDTSQAGQRFSNQFELLERYETLGVFDHVKHHHSENSKNKGKPLVDKKQVDKEVDKNVLNKLVQGDDEHFSERFMNLFKPKIQCGLR